MTKSILQLEVLSLTVWVGGAVKLWEEKADWLTELINELITRLFVEQPLALPGSAKKFYKFIENLKNFFKAKK